MTPDEAGNITSAQAQARLHAEARKEHRRYAQMAAMQGVEVALELPDEKPRPTLQYVDYVLQEVKPPKSEEDLYMSEEDVMALFEGINGGDSISAGALNRLR